MNKIKVINNSKTFIDDPIFNLGFENCVTNNENVILHLDCTKDDDLSLFDNKYKYYLLDLELPNRWMREYERNFGFINEKKYDKIFSIDPFFTINRNKQLNCLKYQYVYFPFNSEYITFSEHKPIDVFYSGHIKEDMIEIKNTIDKFNGLIVANNGGYKATYQEKIKLNSQSKISIVHNFLDIHIYGNDRELFKNLQCTEIRNNTATQHKARVIEAAMLGSFMLCKKDEYNIIEDLFEPGKHFLYFSNKNELEELIQHVLSNYEKYSILAKNTAKYAKENYTTQHFVNKYINL
jgi:spore maturation protein CgeB